MRLSTKSRYAVTAMLDLALHGTRGPVTLAEISENQSISLSYLEQLFAALRAKGLVRGVRGPGGGYYLGRDATEITIGDVICAVDEWVEYTRSGAYRSSMGAGSQSARSLWDDLSEQLFGVLDGIRLSDLVERGEGRDRPAGARASRDRLIGMRPKAA